MILETQRLMLREMTPEDLPALRNILQDDAVMYAYEGAFSEEETVGWLNRQIARYREDGFGLWAVVLKETGNMIGQCGLTMQAVNDNRVLEIGYLFQKAYWHRGYATEAAIACREYAFNTLHVKEIYSIIRKTPTPPRRTWPSATAWFASAASSSTTVGWICRTTYIVYASRISHEYVPVRLTT